MGGDYASISAFFVGAQIKLRGFKVGQTYIFFMSCLDEIHSIFVQRSFRHKCVVLAESAKPISWLYFSRVNTREILRSQNSTSTTSKSTNGNYRLKTPCEVNLIGKSI